MDEGITYNKDGSLQSLVGADAVELMRAATLKASLDLYIKSGGRIIPTRGFGITRMLELATRYTGRTYKRKEAAQASADVHVWVQTMKSALPSKTVE